MEISRIGTFNGYHAHNSHNKVAPRQTLIAPMKMKRYDDGYRMEVSEKIIIPMINDK
jgi:hypothetical protein